MNEFLVTYLDAIDERLLDYLDKDDELRPEVVRRFRHYVSALRSLPYSSRCSRTTWPRST